MVALVLAGGVLAGAVIGYAIPATASSQSGTSSDSAPTVKENGEVFVTNSGVDASWQAVTSAISQKLPTGTSWPDDAPGFFDPSSNGSRDLWEPGLFSTIAARYWRCAWLDAGLDAQRQNNQSAEDAARAALSDFANVPGASGVTFDGYLSAIGNGAKTAGISSEEFEFNVDCGIYLKEGGVR